MLVIVVLAVAVCFVSAIYYIHARKKTFERRKNTDYRNYYAGGKSQSGGFLSDADLLSQTAQDHINRRNDEYLFSQFHNNNR